MKEKTKAYATALIVAFISLMAGCGGGSSASGAAGVNANGSSADNNNSSAQIQGIATPSSVSVVTATNQ